MNTMICSIIVILACFVVWMIVQFLKEWPAYRHK